MIAMDLQICTIYLGKMVTVFIKRIHENIEIACINDSFLL